MSAQDGDAVLPLLNIAASIGQRLGQLSQQLNLAAGDLMRLLAEPHAESLSLTALRLRAENVSGQQHMLA